MCSLCVTPESILGGKYYYFAMFPRRKLKLREINMLAGDHSCQVGGGVTCKSSTNWLQACILDFLQGPWWSETNTKVKAGSSQSCPGLIPTATYWSPCLFHTRWSLGSLSKLFYA